MYSNTTVVIEIFSLASRFKRFFSPTENSLYLQKKQVFFLRIQRDRVFSQQTATESEWANHSPSLQMNYFIC